MSYNDNHYAKLVISSIVARIPPVTEETEVRFLAEEADIFYGKIRRAKFKSWKRLFAFDFVLMTRDMNPSLLLTIYE